MICAMVNCRKSYEGHVTKICAVCMEPVSVCLECYDSYEKVVCPECVNDAILNDSVDEIKKLVS